MAGKNMDSFIRKIVDKYLNILVAGFLLLCSIVIRYHLMKHGSSGDFVGYFVPWLERYKVSIVAGLREGVREEYYVPYNVLLAFASKLNVPDYIAIGIIPCVFDYLASFLIYRMLTDNFSNYVNRTVAMMVSIGYLFIPSIVLNGAAWKQCDSIYSFFVLALLKCVLDNKMVMTFVMFGLAISFKLQAIFIVPVLIILYFTNKKLKAINIVFSIITYLIAGLPAVICGRPAFEVYYSIYFAQAEEHHAMTLNYPNLYMIAMTNYEHCHIYAKLLTVFVFAIVFWYLCWKRHELSDRNIIVLSVWSVWTCCMFLPAMHQRYDYMVAMLFAVCIPVLEIVRTKRLAIISAVLFYIGNIITYSYSLFGDDYNSIFVMCCNVIAYALFCTVLWNCITKEEANGSAAICNE